MRDDTGQGADAPWPEDLEAKLARLTEPPVPEDLLGRCLATVPAPKSRKPVRWAALAAAAVLLVGAGALLSHSKTADAAQVLKNVRDTWAEVPASHHISRMKGPDGTRTEETWFVRGKGRRKEVRAGDELTLVVVFNRRWEFRWDVRGKIASAWSAELIDDSNNPHDNGLVLESEAFLRWAESHRAEIRIVPDKIAGRAVRKMVLKWPGAASQEQAVWFDPDTLRPLKQRMDFGDGRVHETTIDYPDPATVPGDRFEFKPARDVALEVNDPDLGRQVYSPAGAKGAEK